MPPRWRLVWPTGPSRSMEGTGTRKSTHLRGITGMRDSLRSSRGHQRFYASSSGDNWVSSSGARRPRSCAHPSPGQTKDLPHEFLDPLGCFGDPVGQHVGRGGDELMLLVHDELPDGAGLVLGAHPLQGGRGLGVRADRKLGSLVSQRFGKDRGSDADRADRLLRLVHLPDDPRDLRVQGAVGLLHGEVTEILGSAKPARENEGIQLRSLGCGHVADLPAGDSGRLDQDIPALAGAHLASEVVHDVHLVHVGGKADNLRSSPVEGKKREHRLVDLGPVIDTATREYNSNLYGSPPRASCTM